MAETAAASLEAVEPGPLTAATLESGVGLETGPAQTLYALGEIIATEAAAGLQESLDQPVQISDPMIATVGLQELEDDAWYGHLVVDLRLELASEGAYSSVLLLPQAEIEALLPSAGGDGPDLDAFAELVHGLVERLTEGLAEQFEPALQLSVPDAELGEGFGGSDGSLVKIEHQLVVGEQAFTVAHLIPPSALAALAHGTLPSVSVPAADTPPLPAAEPAAAPPTSPVGGTAVHPAAFAPLETEGETQSTTNMDLLLNVPLRVTVELGRRQMTIEEVLALGPGSVIELSRLAGEPLDILVNNQFIARGEVVVVDENFGIRVTEIVAPARRLAAQAR